MPMSDEFPVEAPRSFEEFSACEELQEHFDPPVPEVVPAWILWELVQAGAVLVVCFDGLGIAREPLGLALALRRGSALRVVLYGVRRDLPQYGEVLGAIVAGISGQARDKEVTEILWPFDPLDARWAELFLEVLGAEARRYELRRDHSGEIRYLRALASLPVGKGPVPKRWKAAALKGFFPVNTTRLVPGKLREPTSWNLHLTTPHLVLEIPGQGMASLPASLADPWRGAWEALEAYLDKGYALVGLYRQGDRAFLVLERKYLDR